MNTAIDLVIEREDTWAEGQWQLGRLRQNSNFVFDCLDGFGGDADELDAYSHSLEAIADLAASLDRDAGSREPEAEFQDRALRIFRAGVDEHAVRAKVRRPNTNVFLEPFVNHGEFTELRIACIPPDLSIRLVFFSAHD
jgi:hypothetical protein